MGQQDRRRARVRSEQALRGLLDHLAAVWPRGIDQHPRQPRPHEIDIGPAGGKPEHAGRDFARLAPGTPPAPRRPSRRGHHRAAPGSAPHLGRLPSTMAAGAAAAQGRRSRREPTPGQPGNPASPGPARLARVIAGQGRYREAGQRCRHMPVGRQRFPCRTAPCGTIAAGRAITATRADRRPFTAAIRRATRPRLKVLPGLRSAQGPCTGRAAVRVVVTGT